MSMRPGVYLVVGIADVKNNDPRRVRKASEDELDGDVKYYEDDGNFYHYKIPGYETTVLREVLYNADNSSDGMGVCPQVAGLILHRLEDNTIFRAMALLNKRYMRNGFKIIPEENPEKHTRMFIQSYGITQEDIAEHRFVSGVLESQVRLSRMHWRRAQFYMAQAGWVVPPSQLRYILVWDWG